MIDQADNLRAIMGKKTIKYTTQKSIAKAITIVNAPNDFINNLSLELKLLDKNVDIIDEYFLEQEINLEDKSELILIDSGDIDRENFVYLCDFASNLIIVTSPGAKPLSTAYAIIERLNEKNALSASISLIIKDIEKTKGREVYENFNRIVKRFFNIELDFLGVMSEAQDIKTIATELIRKNALNELL